MPSHDSSRQPVVERKIIFSILLNMVIVIFEFVGGLLSGSLALLSDAVHNLTDVFALAIALVTGRLSSRSPSLRHTYGLRRMEVISALVNSAILLVVSTLIFKEAIVRFYHPQPINGSLMFWVGLVGLIANLLSVLLLHGHSKHDMNIKGAYLHLIQDTLSSVLVVVAALLSRWSFGPYLDTIVSLIVLVIIGRSGWNLFSEGIHIIMEGTPLELNIEEIQKDLQTRFPIDNVHHIHVWEVNKGYRIFTAHLSFCETSFSDIQKVMHEIHAHLLSNWGIQHATLEPETHLCSDRIITCL